MSDDRPTDEESRAMGDLGVHLKNLRAAAAMLAGTPAHGAVLETIDALVGEIRRLRSDDWLQRAAEEIPHSFPQEYIVEILRKHRDGKA